MKKHWSAEECIIDGCTKKKYTKNHGWCHMHDARWRRHGDTNKGPTRICTVDSCDESHMALGLCKAHWQRLKKRGAIDAHIPIRLHLPQEEKEKLAPKIWHFRNNDHLTNKEIGDKLNLSAGTISKLCSKFKYLDTGKKCSVGGCNRSYRCSGLCARHYAVYRYHNDIQTKLRSLLRSRLYMACRHYGKRGSAVKDLGCTVAELKVYLESLWEFGMSWENWTVDGWHIDHVRPLSSFDLTNRKELLVAVHYTNLVPLWADENLIKSATEGVP